MTCAGGSVTAEGADVTTTDGIVIGGSVEAVAFGSSVKGNGNGSKSFDAAAPPRRFDINACSRRNANSSSSSSLIVATPADNMTQENFAPKRKTEQSKTGRKVPVH